MAYNDDYVYFVVVDGFRIDSRGLNIGELGDFLKNNDAIQATDAVSLDSGTSSTMVIDGAVVNNTQCNFFRNCGWPLVDPDDPLAKPPEETVLDPALTYKTEWDNPTGAVEALIGTTFLMVSVAVDLAIGYLHPHPGGHHHCQHRHPPGARDELRLAG